MMGERMSLISKLQSLKPQNQAKMAANISFEGNNSGGISERIQTLGQKVKSLAMEDKPITKKLNLLA